MTDKSQGVGLLGDCGSRGSVCEVWVSGAWGFPLSSVLHVSPKGDHVVV